MTSYKYSELNLCSIRGLRASQDFMVVLHTHRRYAKYDKGSTKAFRLRYWPLHWVAANEVAVFIMFSKMM